MGVTLFAAVSGVQKHWREAQQPVFFKQKLIYAHTLGLLNGASKSFQNRCKIGSQVCELFWVGVQAGDYNYSLSDSYFCLTYIWFLPELLLDKSSCNCVHLHPMLWRLASLLVMFSRDHSARVCTSIKAAINADAEWTYSGIWHTGKQTLW